MKSTDVSNFWGPYGAAMDYFFDAAQRSVLYWDVMRQRGNQYREHLAQTAPHVLDYQVELIVDGRRLERPVNYALGAGCAARRNRDRPNKKAVCHCRPPRRTRSRDRRL